MMNNAIVENFENNSNHEKKLSENVDVAALIRFMHHMKILDLFAGIPDPRQQSKTTYTLASLSLWALAVCLFRQGSKNALKTTLEGLHPEQRESMLHFLEIEGKNLPHSSTVDDALARVDYEAFNQILLEMFSQMNTRKFFYNHAAEILPENTYHIGTDGCHLHTYTHPHVVDEHGNNCCPYCLPRRRHAGTDKEEIYWVHIVVTFVFICDDFTIPLYVYPLKAQQVNTEQNDEKLKQECELIAAYTVLSIIRERFPKINITFLGDGLYANRPFIHFCDQHRLDYTIVRKEKSLTKLGNHCDELSQLELYQKSYSHQEIATIGDRIVKRQASWFNGEHLDDSVTTNVLRFKEKVLGEDGKVYSDYTCEWLCSKRLSKNNCFKRAKRGRMRWNHENFHNTVKNRGFNIKHDMARTHPVLLFNWKLITCVAFFISEIFNLSTY